MLKNKRGEGEGKAVAVLLLVIALFIALYVLILPPEERSQLLGENETDTGITNTKSTTNEGSVELFTSTPGLISPEKTFGTNHQINAVNLFVKTEPKLINLASSLDVARSLFTKSSPTLKFEVKELGDINKVTFFFTVLKAEGILKLKINGMEFFSEDVAPGIKLVEVPITFLKANNELEIEVSHPGVAIWNTNEYALKSVGVKEEFEIINSKEERFFTLTQEEKKVMNQVKLSYFLHCNSKPARDFTLLRVFLNDNNIFSGQTRCVSTNQNIDIETADLIPGNNKLLFSIDDGDFSFNNIELQTRTDSEDFPTYIFQVGTNIVNDIPSRRKNIKLQLFLDNDSKQKSARIKINNGSLFLNTNTGDYEADVTEFIKEGSNFIKIVPNTDFNIVGLKVIVK